MKKLYAFAAAAMMAATAMAQNGDPLYITGEGQFEGGTWSPENAAQFTYADGVYTIEINDLVQFKISTVMGSWDDFNTAALTCNYGDEAGVTVNLEPGDANILCPWKGDYKVTVAGDLSTILLETETPKVEGPIEIYLRGDMNGWNPEPAWMMTQVTDKVFKFVFAEGQSIKVGESFKIADANWGKYNTGGDGENLMLDTDIEVFNGGNPSNMQFEEEVNGAIWLVYDLEGSNYLWATNDKEAEPEWAAASAVKAIEVANAAVRYFNLQGMEVKNPANGLYIVVKGEKVTKEVVR